MFERYTKLEDIASDSIFLFGARQTGKTTLIGMLWNDEIVNPGDII
ncbi:MAG: hypothetical protein ACI4BC_10005 [Muribaculaceae bacterium]